MVVTKNTSVMEFLNKIELKGVVGNASHNKVGNTNMVRFSVCTEYAYNGKDGGAVIDVTWHNCTAWESDKNKISNITKGAFVHIIGRVRNTRYTASDGTERTISEILVNEVETI